MTNVNIASTTLPRVICVSGMHRSGTSLAARALELLGASLGDPRRLLDPGPDNTAGYWENRAIKELNDVLLASLGGSWDEPPVLAPGWETDPGLDPFRQQARAEIDLAFGDRRSTDLVAFKDPRLSLLLPFWRTVVDIESTIVVVRDPDEVRRSLAARNDLRSSQAALLWIRYLLAATANDPAHLLVTQEAFFGALPETLGRVAAHVGLPPPSPDVIASASEHIDPSLHHHSASNPEPGPDDPLTRLATSIWNDGQIRLDLLAPEAAAALAEGFLHDAGDDAALGAARAQVVALTEEIRARNRVRDAQISTRIRHRVRVVRARVRRGAT